MSTLIAHVYKQQKIKKKLSNYLIENTDNCQIRIVSKQKHRSKKNVARVLTRETNGLNFKKREKEGSYFFI